MGNNLLLQEIETLLSHFSSVPTERKYWLIRTFGGKYYSSFLEHNYVALAHDEMPYSKISEIQKESNGDHRSIISRIRKACEEIYEKESRPGLIANQIFKFIFELKKGDIVVIPSENSEFISIGIVEDTQLINVNDSLIAETGCPYYKRKKISWRTSNNRRTLDPMFYSVLFSHQAINDITSYSDIIERTIGNFYIKEDVGNLVLNVKQDDGINAVDLFQLGYCLLNYSKNYFDDNNLPFSINDIEVKINLNSRGKIHLKAPNANTIWLIAILVLCINGGGLKFKADGIDFDMSTDGLINNIIDYQNNYHDRDMTDKIMNSIDSLQIQTPDDAVKVFQQFNVNKR